MLVNTYQQALLASFPGPIQKIDFRMGPGNEATSSPVNTEHTCIVELSVCTCSTSMGVSASQYMIHINQPSGVQA